MIKFEDLIIGEKYIIHNKNPRNRGKNDVGFGIHIVQCQGVLIEKDIDKVTVLFAFEEKLSTEIKYNDIGKCKYGISNILK